MLHKTEQLFKHLKKKIWFILKTSYSNKEPWVNFPTVDNLSKPLGKWIENFERKKKWSKIKGVTPHKHKIHEQSGNHRAK